MQQAKQPFCTRLQLLAWLALNAGKHTGNQPTRLAHLDDGNDRAILVQGDEGPAQVVRLGHQGTPSVGYSDDGAISSPPAPYHLSAGGRWIRTSGSGDCCSPVDSEDDERNQVPTIRAICRTEGYKYLEWTTWSLRWEGTWNKCFRRSSTAAVPHSISRPSKPSSDTRIVRKIAGERSARPNGKARLRDLRMI